MSEDFNFYGEDEVKENIDIKGITDIVSKYIFVGMVFPCICMKEDLQLPKYKWEGVSRMVKGNAEGKDITVYMKRSGEMYSLGKLSSIQVTPFLELVGLDNLVGYGVDEKEIVGDRLYALGGF